MRNPSGGRGRVPLDLVTWCTASFEDSAQVTAMMRAAVEYARDEAGEAGGGRDGLAAAGWFLEIERDHPLQGWSLAHAFASVGDADSLADLDRSGSVRLWEANLSGARTLPRRQTALMVAVEAGPAGLPAVAWLAQHCPDPDLLIDYLDATNTDGLTAAQVAIGVGNRAAAKVLLCAGASAPSPGNGFGWEGDSSGDPSTDPSDVPSGGSTDTHAAASSGSSSATCSRSIPTTPLTPPSGASWSWNGTGIIGSTPRTSGTGGSTSGSRPPQPPDGPSLSLSTNPETDGSGDRTRSPMNARQAALLASLRDSPVVTVFPSSDLAPIRRLGQGGFGACSVARLRRGGIQVVVKVWCTRPDAFLK